MQNIHLLTTAEAADRLGCSVATVVRRATDGKLPHVMRGPGERGGFFFDPDVIDAERLKRIEALSAELAALAPSPSESQGGSDA